MSDFSSFGKLFIFVGILMLALGLLILLGGKFLNLGRLPGDIFFQKGNVTFYFPIVTSILVSILLTILLNLFLRR